VVFGPPPPLHIGQVEGDSLGWAPPDLDGDTDALLWRPPVTGEPYPPCGPLSGERTRRGAHKTSSAYCR